METPRSQQTSLEALLAREAGSSNVPGERNFPCVCGGFRLHQELGRGGMGVVYRAEEIASGRLVALKVMPPGLAVSEEALQRFRREARLAAAISDTHCVFVYGAHVIEGAPAISMELCGAETLEDRIRSGERIPVRTAVQWMIEILGGLEAAHHAGVLHRDVKPSNCFLLADGRVKIGDFGLARTLERDVQLTQSGAFLGSPLYASPEQIRGRDLDLRSDLYSCGATLFALLAGKPPFRGSNMGEVLARILSEPAERPRSSRAGIPRKLERIVLKAMAKDPGKRYQDHAQFRAALLPFVSEVAPAKPAWRFAAYLVDVMVGGLLGGAAVAAFIALDVNLLYPERELAAYAMVACVEFLYFSLCEGLLGATFGKWIVGQRVIALASGHASLPRASLRTLVFVAPALVWDRVARIEGIAETIEGLPLTFAVSWLLTAALFVTARRRNGFRGIHELASGTQVVQSPTPFGRFARSSRVPERSLAASAELPATVGPYRVEGILGETPLGPLLRGRDPELGRTVWLQSCSRSQPVLDDLRRSLARPGRLRWLQGLGDRDQRFEVFEDPGGSAMLEILPARRGFEWSRAVVHLSAFAEELAEVAETGGEAPGGRMQVLFLEQVWVDRQGQLRLLDQPIGSGPFEELSPLRLLAEVSRRVVLDARAGGRGLPGDLPVHAEETMRRILELDRPFADVREARRALEDLASRPRPLTRRIRGSLIVASVLPTLIVPLSVGVALFLASMSSGERKDPERLQRLLRAEASAPVEDPDRPARRVLISRYARRSPAEIGEDRLDDQGRALLAAARDPDEKKVTAEQLREALAQLDRSARARGREPEDFVFRRDRAVALAFGGTAGLWIGFAILAAFVFRGGPLLRLFGLALRGPSGELASRLRCAARATILWSPCILLLALRLSPIEAPYGWLLLAVLIVYVVGIAWSIVDPIRGPHDRLAGTRLVPR